MKQKINQKKKGVLIVNLGTPKSSNSRDVFCYLNEFLTDPRVIDLPWLKRQLLVRGFIVPLRYKQSARQYTHLWTEKGSPLLFYGEQVKEKLQQSLGESYIVSLAMRYQFPSISQELEKLKKESLDELIILPLFPQYASATTGSVHQKVMEEIRHWNFFPKMTFIHHYFDHPSLIEAFCLRAKQYLVSSYDHVLFSFHGLPERQIKKADQEGKCLSTGCCMSCPLSLRFCYKAQCYETARLIAEKLELQKKNYTVCFQSRLGKEPWIQPYTIDILEKCAAQGLTRLLVFSPSFVCDCLETTLEIAFEYAQEFKKWGGKELQLVEGLNDHSAWIKTLKDLVLNLHC